MCYNWSAIEESVLLGVPKVVGWLGLMSAFQLSCKFLKNEYFPYFVGIFAGVNECSFPKFVSFMVGFGDSLAQGSEELWCSRNLCLSGADFLAFLWPKESWHSRNSCLSGADFWCFSGPKCRRIMAFQKFMSFCIQKHLNFMVWVSFLAGVIN